MENNDKMFAYQITERFLMFCNSTFWVARMLKNKSWLEKIKSRNSVSIEEMKIRMKKKLKKFTSYTRRLIYKAPKNSQKAITKKEQNDNPNIHFLFRLLSHQMSQGKDQIKSIDVYIKQYDKMRNT